MNFALFLITIIVLIIIARIGAIALELTGLDFEQAQFQALSCFTRTGFTTKEAELITTKPQRRKIAIVLMILGYAGFVTIIATVANVIRTDILHYPLPFLQLYLPATGARAVNLVIILAILYAIFKISRNATLIAKFTDLARRHLIKRDFVRPVSFNELVVATGGYGVCSIIVRGNSPLINRTLHDLSLRKQDIIVLAIDRKGKVTSMPTVETKILDGDNVVCFGNLQEIRKKLV